MAEMEPDHLTSSMSEEIVTFVISGELSLQAVNALRVEIIAAIRDKAAQAMLCDMRPSTGPHLITDAYYRARNLPSDITVLPIAIVDRDDNPDFKSFYETTASNSGWSIKWFADVTSAKAWLKKKLEERAPKPKGGSP